MDKESLIHIVLDFMSVIQKCHTETKHANDRNLYANDLVVCMGWIVKIRSLSDYDVVYYITEEILSSQTDKIFCDFYRSGVWGDLESKAYSELKKKLLQKLCNE